MKANQKREPLPHEVLVTNSSSYPIFVRLSGGDGDEKFHHIKIDKNSFRLFDRKINSIYRMNVCNTEKTLGPVYNVKTGCEYDFDKSGNLTSPAGEHLLSILHKY